MLTKNFFASDFSGKNIRSVYHYAMTFFQFDMDMHNHPAAELLYAASSRCTVNFTDKCVKLKKGELLFINPGIPHQLYIEQGRECRLINLELETVLCKASDLDIFGMLCKNQGFKELHKEAPDFFIVSDDGCSLRQNMEMVVNALHRETDEGIAPYEISAMIFLLLSELCRRYEETLNAGISSFVNQALIYIDAHYSEAISVEQLAKSCCISKSHLQRAFRASTGKTLVQVIQEKRVEKAKFLLRTSNLAVIEVAVETGFNNRQHFAETFTKIAGVSPSVYRKSSRNLLGLGSSPDSLTQEETGRRSLIGKGCPGAFLKKTG